MWSDGTSIGYQGATIGGGPSLLSVGGSAGSRLPRTGPLVTYEGNWCNDFTMTDPSCNYSGNSPQGQGPASFEKSVTIRMPIGQAFLIEWHAESLGDAMAVVDPLLTVHPDDAPYVRLEVSGVEPPTPAPALLDGVDMDALAARGYNVELLRELGLWRPPAPSNAAPVADPGPDQAIVQIGATVHLDGSQSYDPDGDAEAQHVDPGAGTDRSQKYGKRRGSRTLTAAHRWLVGVYRILSKVSVDARPAREVNYHFT